MHQKGAIRRTNIQMLLGLNYSRFTEYLDWVVAHGLIVEITNDDDKDNIGKFTLTQKGRGAYNR
ncbi:MAG: winged helix-turn-helix domain-containing protein, partial [Rhabdochlamydiaceae bacterium]